MMDPDMYFGGVPDVRNLIYQQLDPKTLTFIGQLVRDDLGSKTDDIWINNMRREYFSSTFLIAR